MTNLNNYGKNECNKQKCGKVYNTPSLCSQLDCTKFREFDELHIYGIALVFELNLTFIVIGNQTPLTLLNIGLQNYLLHVRLHTKL